MAIVSKITEEKIQSDAVFAAIADDSCGAWNLFLGVTRNHHQGKAVDGLEYEHYGDMAKSELQRLCEEVAKEFSITNMLVIHRVGAVPIGEASLLVAAASHHRHQALEGTHAFINRLKEDVPIWKKESFSDGSKGWVEGESIRPTE